MARVAQFTAPIQILVTEDVRDRLEAIAEKNEVSIAAVVRDMLDTDLQAAESRWAAS